MSEQDDLNLRVAKATATARAEKIKAENLDSFKARLNAGYERGKEAGLNAIDDLYMYGIGSCLDFYETAMWRTGYRYGKDQFDSHVDAVTAAVEKRIKLLMPEGNIVVSKRSRR